MTTLHTNFKVPESLIAEAKRRANQTGVTQYLCYLRASKGEPITIIDEEPCYGMVAEVSPNTQYFGLTGTECKDVDSKA